MGENRWLQSNTWPPTKTRPRNFYMNDGRLSSAPPTRSGRETFTADPTDPVPTIGGNTWIFPVAGLNPGPAVQNEISHRHDVISFETYVLSKPLKIAGPVKCVVFGSLDGETGDWVARLVDIDSEGRRRWVADGILRAHFQQGDLRVSSRIPGRIEAYHIDLWATAATFPRGHRIGIEICGSSFPKWEVNLNSLEGTPRTSTHTIFWGRDYPSRLTVNEVEDA